MSKDKTFQILSIGIIAALFIGVGGLIYFKKAGKFPIKQSYKKIKPHIPRKISNFDVHGIDVSHHQGLISWDKIEHPDTLKSIDFVFIRATVGTRKDSRFEHNWKEAKKHDFHLGAYHYYWPNVNSTIQAENFINHVNLNPGDLPPVLDIEKTSSIQSHANLRRGLRNWIEIIENHYGIRPIIYTGDAFYRNYLRTDSYFKNYDRLWIANYNRVQQPSSKWHFWQLTDRAKINGVKGYVDFNVFKNSFEEFESLLLVQ